MLRRLFSKSSAGEPLLSGRERRNCRQEMVESLESRTLLNAITTENALPGTPQSTWDIAPGTADPTLQGFPTQLSVNVGTTVSFKITDNTLANYVINIYRLGYYQGNGARLITSIAAKNIKRTLQPNPIINTTTGEEDCGNWSVSASWAVPSTAVSGVYMAEMVRSDTGGKSRMLFVVRNDSSHSDVLYQTSDATWEAYNHYGSPSSPLTGKSLYDGIGQALMADAVSYNRPIINGDLDGSQIINSFFYAEYPIIRFMEQNGYDVTYTTEIDTDLHGSLILNHKLFMAGGHDEYWSANMVNNVTAARNAGVNLAFLTGNEVSWETRYAPSIDGSNTPDRTLICYKQTAIDGVVDPAAPAQTTSLWLDSAFAAPNGSGGLPQNALTGTLYAVNWYEDNNGVSGWNGAISVPSADSSLAFWRNTAVASLQAGQTYTTAAGYIGYEWDVDADNGSRPAGSMDLSSSTFTIPTPYSYNNDGELNGGMFVNDDNVYGAGTATHSLTLYKASSGALVFGAGTIQYSWALDNDHRYQYGSSVTNVPTDVNLQQATINLLGMMKITPGSLKSGLVAFVNTTDTKAPKSTITAPTAGSTLQGSVTITGTATDSGGGVVAGVEVSTDGGQTWHPATGRTNWTCTYIPPATGTYTIESRAVDDSGNLETPSDGISVNTMATTVFAASAGPAALYQNLTDSDAISAGGIELGMRFTASVNGTVTGVTFWKADYDTGTHTGELWSSTGQLLATATFTNESSEGWQQVNFSTPVSITANTTYIVSYQDTSGTFSATPNGLASAITNSPLQAPASTAPKPNGIFSYDTIAGQAIFPASSTGQATNYWVSPVFTAVPSAPTKLTAAASSPPQVQLSWTASTGVVGGYSVERSSDGVSYSIIAPNVQSTSYVDTTAQAAMSYDYRVRAVNASGYSPYSNIGVVTTPPTAPVGLMATTVTASSIGLSWTPTTGATGYLVLRKGPTDLNYVQIGTSSVATYADSTVAASTTYLYEVIALGTGGNSPASAPLSVTSAASAPAPSAPTSLLAAASSSTQVVLTWTASTGTVTAYHVERSTNGGNFGEIATGITLPTYTDTTAQAATSYTYRVRAENTGSFSGYSNTSQTTTVPAAPIGLATTSVTSSAVALSWTASTGAASYQVLRKGPTDPGYLQIGTPASTTFTDSTVSSSTSYSYEVVAVGTGGNSAASAPLPVTTSAVAPSAPTGLLATASSSTQVVLTWTASTGTVTAYHVERSTNGGNFGEIATGITLPTYTDNTASPNTAYTYRVRAENSGSFSGYSGTATVTTAPPAPTGLATIAVSASSVSLTWNASAGATSYQVLRKGPTDPGYVQIATPSSTSYIDSTVSASTIYSYEVIAVSSNGNSPASTPLPVTTSAATPSAPTNLSASASSSTQVVLTWTASTGTVTAYHVERSTDGVMFTEIAGNVTTPTYPDNTAQPNTSYTYRVRAENTGSFSGYSNTSNVTTEPAAPTGLQATSVTSSSVTLTWTASAGATGYQVLRKGPSDPGYVQVGTATTTTLTDGTVAAATAYLYEVIATSPAGSSPASTPLSVNTSAATPSAPTGLLATASSSTQVVLTWTASTGTVTTYHVERSTNGVSFGEIATGITLTTYTDTTAQAATSYTYRVRAENAGSFSGYSNTSQVTTVPAAPTGLATTSVTSSTVALSWTASTGATSYQVLRKGPTDPGYLQIGTPASTTFTDSTVSASTTYSYEVVAVGAGGNSAASTPLPVTTSAAAPSAPTNLLAAASSSTQVVLTWTASTGTVTAYHVERSINGVNFGEIATGITLTTYTDTTAQAATSYTYRVRAENTGSFSGYSNTSQTTTAPAAPTGLATSSVTSSAVALTWSSSTGATSYQVLRKGPTDPGYVQIGTPASTIFTDSTVSASTTYSYEVIAVGAGGNSAASTPLPVTTSAVSPPAQPQNFIAVAAGLVVNLQWNANTESNLAGYNLSRGTSAIGPFTQLNSSLLTTTTYADSTAPTGVALYYQLVAVNTLSASSTPATATVTISQTTVTTTLFSPSAAPAANFQNINDPGITAAGGVELGLKFQSDVSGMATGVRFWKGSLDTGAHSGELWTSSGQLLATTSFTNETASGWQQVSFSTPVSITANTVYVVSYQSTSPYLAYAPNTFASAGIDNAPLHALANGVAGGNSVYSYDATPGTKTFPTSYNGQAPNYWVDLTFSSTTTQSPTLSLMSPSSAPLSSLQDVNDPGITAAGGVELGVKFESSVGGSVLGVQFWKGSLDTGVQTGELWSSTGQLLATATFTNETASGWQQVLFSVPVAITANTVYVISYHTTSAYIAYSPNTFASFGITNGPLQALAGGVSGPDGVYSYDTTPGVSSFPTQSNGQSPYYWVDVIFQPSGS